MQSRAVNKSYGRDSRKKRESISKRGSEGEGEKVEGRVRRDKKERKVVREWVEGCFSL